MVDLLASGHSLKQVWTGWQVSRSSVAMTSFLFCNNVLDGGVTAAVELRTLRFNLICIAVAVQDLIVRQLR